MMKITNINCNFRTYEIIQKSMPPDDAVTDEIEKTKHVDHIEAAETLKNLLNKNEKI